MYSGFSRLLSDSARTVQQERSGSGEGRVSVRAWQVWRLCGARAGLSTTKQQANWHSRPVYIFKTSHSTHAPPNGLRCGDAPCNERWPLTGTSTS